MGEVVVKDSLTIKHRLKSSMPAESGIYSWWVPVINSEHCRVKVTNTGNPAVYDTSNAIFTVYECQLEGDLSGDCAIDLNDLAIVAGSWLDCRNPYDLNCSL